MSSNVATEQDLERMKRDIEEALERQTVVLTESIRGIDTSFNKSRGAQKARFDNIDVRFNAVDRKLENLADDMSIIKSAMFEYLHSQGIKLDEKKIFAI